MKRNKKATLNFSVSLFYKVTTIVVGILLPKLFVTTYGSSVNGLQASITQIFSYITLLEAGIGESVLQSLFGPVAKKEYNTVNSFLSATTYYYNKIGLIYLAILLVMSFVYPMIVEVEGLSYLSVALFVLLTGAMNGINFFFLAKVKLLISAFGDEYIVSTISTVFYFFSSISKIALIMAGVNVLFVQLTVFLINLFFTFVYYLVSKKRYPWLSFKEKADFSCMKQKKSVLVHKISGLIFQNVDILLLTFLCDLQTVSIYTMYKLVVNMVTTVIATFGDSFNFVFGQTYNTEEVEGKPKYCMMIDVFNMLYSAIAFALYSTMFIMILPFMKLYTDGMDINYIYPLLPCLYLIIEVLTVGREAMLRTITVAGHFKLTQWRSVAEAVINLTVSIFAIIICKYYFGRIGGLYGALLGTIVAMIYRTIDINIYANKRILHRSCFKTFKVFFLNIALFCAVILLNRFVNLPIENYFDFCLAGFVIASVFLLSFIFVQAIASIKETKRIMVYISKRINNKK